MGRRSQEEKEEPIDGEASGYVLQNLCFVDLFLSPPPTISVEGSCIHTPWNDRIFNADPNSSVLVDCVKAEHTSIIYPRGSNLTVD
jgi:hypothetical protein